MKAPAKKSWRLTRGLSIPAERLKLASYNMGRSARDCVGVFCELTGYDKGKVGTAPTPFIDESKDPLAAAQTAPEAAAKAAPAGELSHIATKCLMKNMYIARFARPDLLRAVGALTAMVTRWDELCDRKLLRIIKYIDEQSIGDRSASSEILLSILK